MGSICLSVEFEFSASHRLFQPALSDPENMALYGKCSNPNGHGHNYRLVVRVSGNINKKTGMVLDAKKLKDLVTETILDDVDHKDLNRDVAWLRGVVPSTEVVADAMFERLAHVVALAHPEVVLDSITLHETRRISVTVSRGNT
jgi:6-pyruvoyltetrahydropterin/6-carboxytetrahydropterin synthase